MVMMTNSAAHAFARVSKGLPTLSLADLIGWLILILTQLNVYAPVCTVHRPN